MAVSRVRFALLQCSGAGCPPSRARQARDYLAPAVGGADRRGRPFRGAAAARQGDQAADALSLLDFTGARARQVVFRTRSAPYLAMPFHAVTGQPLTASCVEGIISPAILDFD